MLSRAFQSLRRQKLASLTDVRFLAVKAGLAAALALLLGRLVHNPDVVTTAFVAILSCSPAVLMGVRISFEQWIGSIVGGVFGAAAELAGLPIFVGVPLAVACALFVTHQIGFVRGTTVAAFTALFVQVVTFGGPMTTFALRLEAVLLAGGSALVVNVAVSSLFYGNLFSKRLRRVHDHLIAILRVRAGGGFEPLGPLFAQLAQLEAELAQATLEAARLRRQATAARLQEMSLEALRYRDVVHLLGHLDYLLRSEDTALRAGMPRWLLSGSQRGEPPMVLPANATATAQRLATLFDMLDGPLV